jgi:hypothetical protein
LEIQTENLSKQIQQKRFENQNGYSTQRVGAANVGNLTHRRKYKNYNHLGEPNEEIDTQRTK